MKCSSCLVLLLPRFTNDTDMLKQRRIHEYCSILLINIICLEGPSLVRPNINTQVQTV